MYQKSWFGGLGNRLNALQAYFFVYACFTRTKTFSNTPFFPPLPILDNMFAIEDRGLKSLHLKQHLGNCNVYLERGKAQDSVYEGLYRKNEQR